MRKKVVKLFNTKAGCKINGKHIGQDKSFIDKCTVLISDLPFASRQVHLHLQSDSERDHISVELLFEDMRAIVKAWQETVDMEQERAKDAGDLMKADMIKPPPPAIVGLDMHDDPEFARPEIAKVVQAILDVPARCGSFQFTIGT